MKKLVFLLCFIHLQSFAQSGAGGIGNNIGTSNLRFWARADQGVTLSSMQAVSWSDLSGYNNNATTVSSSVRPTHIPNTLNGYPVLRFDGIDDYFDVGTSSSLNMTQWSFLVVGKVNTNKNYNYWFGKGNDGQENYEFLAYTDPFMHTPIYFTDGTRSWLNTATTSTINNYAIWQYDYSAAGRAIYLNGALNASDAVSKTPQTNGFTMLIGNERGLSRFLDGDIAEIVMFNALQNDVQRIIMQNYLASRYNITLASNDVYAGDTPANGNYDHGVAGIGQSSTGNSHTSFAPSVSNGLGITYVSGFANGDYVMVGHNFNGINNQQFNDLGGMTGPLKARWRRDWYFDVTNTGANIVGNLSFDMSDGGVFTTPSIPSNYVLLYRAGQTGNWTEVTTASNISADVINFNNITLANDGYYTIGTRNYVSSPLPVNITSFKGYHAGQNVNLEWTTVAKNETHHFEIYRSKDGFQWDFFQQVDGQGTKNFYQIVDEKPFTGTSYYKLKLVEAGRNEDVSYIISVNIPLEDTIVMYPNPCSTHLQIDGLGNDAFKIFLYDAQGKNLPIRVQDKHEKALKIDTSNLPKGMYVVEIHCVNRLQPIRKKIVVN